MNALSNCRVGGKPLSLLAVVAATILLTACSSVPEPVGEMASARAVVRNLSDTEARTYAAVEADRARTKLQRAEAALRAENFDEARRLATEAEADAELARAKTDAAKATRAASELEQSIQILRSEIERAQSKQ
ncbi:MAG: DUF4398 domain-containing protein [Haliea sp.]|uniref:DUF4398 domain-containing protein n=1 Tax=Haliea sp. TaxID=1932666 RepID=UPI0032EDF17B